MRAETVARRVAEALIVLLPATALLYRTDFFPNDWYNHAWVTGYFAEFLRHHRALPVSLNTASHVGLAAPLFYGYLFYPLTGVVALAFGAGGALRVLAAATFALEYLAVRTIARRAGADRGLAIALGTLVVWAVFPLTNLYSRTALPEFFAVGALTCATCAWFYLLLARGPLERAATASVTALAFTLAVGFHPITAMLGTLYFTALLALSAALPLAGGLRAFGRAVAWLGVFAPLSVLVLAPWLWLMRELGPQIRIAQSAVMEWFYAPLIDNWLVRFVPAGAAAWDATLNVALVVFVAGLTISLARREGRAGRSARVPVTIGAVALLAGALVLTVSASRAAAEAVPSFLRLAQFPSRLVSEVDLLLLAGALALLAWNGRRKVAGLALVITASVSLVGVFLAVKAARIVDTRVERGLVEAVATPLRLPRSFVGYSDYVVRQLYRDLIPQMFKDEVLSSVSAKFPPRDGERFGEPAPMTLALGRAGWVGTNVLPFPWSTFELDGVRVAGGDLRIYNVDGTAAVKAATAYRNRLVAVRVPAGAHTLMTRFEAPEAWPWARACALALLAIWAVATLLLASALPVFSSPDV